MMQMQPIALSNSMDLSPARNLLRCFPWLMLLRLLLLAGPARAQSGQEFVGHIEDASHASIAGATVTIHNEGTGEDIVVKATHAGDYTAPYLKIGTYTIAASMQGFKEVSRTHITLSTDQNSKIDFVLPIGNVTETVTVNSSGAQIELSKADRGLIIDAEQVQELPTDGRNVLQLFALSPGGTNLHNPQFTRSQDNVGADLHSNGLSGQPVQENLDGSTNDNPSGFAVGFVPPLDSVAEFKVVLNPYDASYGRAGGGAIDITLKSGTNKIHGDIYDYWRRPWLDANSFGNDYTHALNPGNPIKKPQHKRDQFGLEVDGPVYIPHIYNGRDKTFFTIQWEQAYENLPDSGLTTSSIPNPQWLTGNFSGAQYFNTTTQSLQPLVIYDPLQYVAGSTSVHLPFSGNIIPTTCTPTPPNTQCSHLNPVGLALAQYYAGTTPNNNPGAGVSPYTNNYVNQGVENDISRTGLVKLEQNFGPRDRGSIRWGGFERYAVENRNGIPLSNPSNAAFHQIQPKDQTFAIDEIHTFSPTFILENKANVDNLKLGFLNGVFGNFIGPLGFSSHYQSNLAGIPNLFPNINTSPNVNGTNLYSPGTGYVELGVGGPGNYTINHVLAYQPSITLIRGRHTIRAGFDMRLYQVANPGTGSNPTFSFSNQTTQQFYNNNRLGGDSTGAISGNSLASLLIGDPISGSLKYSISPFNSQHYYAGWAQDDWKVTPKLTLNFGIRYDVLQAPVERHNKLNYAFDRTSSNTQINNQVQALHPAAYCSVTPATTPGTCLSGPITGGIRFAGTTTDQTGLTTNNPRGAYATNLLHIQPRFGAAYAFSNRTSLRAGFGEMYINNNSNDSSNGFSASSTYTASANNGPNGNFQPLGNFADPYPATAGNPAGTVQPLGASLGLATTPGSTINFTNPSYQVPSVWEYSVSLEQLLTNRDVLDISYSGSRLYNGEGNLNINPQSAAYTAPCDFDRTGNPLSHNICDSTGTGANQGFTANPFQNATLFSGSYLSNSTISRGALSRPFPAFTDITQSQSNIIHTWYNSLQVSVSHNVSRALTVHANYTWSKAMTSGTQIDATNGIYARSIDGNDRPNILSFSSVFYVPVGRGKTLLGNVNRLVDAAIGGWEISPLYVYTEGVPWTNGTPGANNNWIVNSPVGIKAHDVQPNATHAYKRLQGVNPCVAYETNQTIGGVSQTVLVNGPTYTEFGCTSPALIRLAPSYSVVHNVVYYGVRQGSTHEFDASISKRFAWNEKANLQLRLDAFNILNHPNWSGSYNNDPTSIYFGSLRKGPDSPSNLPRDLQLSGKLIW